MQELHTCLEEHDRDVARLRVEVERLRKERDDLVGQLRFAVEHANRETRAAASMHAELLARTTVPAERLDFCCDGDHVETTAVIPRPGITSRRRVRDDDTIRT